MEEEDIIRIVTKANRGSQWTNVVHREIAIESYNLGKLTNKEKCYSREDLLKAINYLPYHIDYGNITGRLSNEDIEQWIKELETTEKKI